MTALPHPPLSLFIKKLSKELKELEEKLEEKEMRWMELAE
jgi:hypothetical protein